MKKIKEEKGAISILVILTMLFFVSFLIVTYIFVSNKANIQMEATRQVKDMYEQDANEIYNSYFANNQTIPIYTLEQLLKIGTNEHVQIDEVGGKFYYFSPNATYILMNDIIYNAYEYGEDYYWTPIGNREDLEISFIGNGHTIEVKYKNEDGELYSKIYSEENNFAEPIEYIFSINASPESAKVTIDGVETNSVIVEQGTSVTWKVEAENYTSQEGTQIVNGDTTLNIDLDIIRYTLTINPTPEDSNVIIFADGQEIVNGKGTQSVEINIGTSVECIVERMYYYSQSGTAVMNEDITADVVLEVKPEQTLVLTPSSVEAEDWTNVDNANADIDSSSYAMSWNTDKFYFNFDASAIDSNAKITSIIASYKMGQTVAGNDVDVILEANGVQCLSTTTESITISGGKVYEASATNLPTGADVNKNLRLSINNVSGGADILRLYGARLTITYIEP